jgi:hypothetical protein
MVGANIERIISPHMPREDEVAYANRLRMHYKNQPRVKGYNREGDYGAIGFDISFCPSKFQIVSCHFIYSCFGVAFCAWRKCKQLSFIIINLIHRFKNSLLNNPQRNKEIRRESKLRHSNILSQSSEFAPNKLKTLINANQDNYMLQNPPWAISDLQDAHQ